MARTPQEIHTEFERLKKLLNSLPEAKKDMAAEIKTNMRNLQEEMKAAQAGPAKKTKKQVRKSNSIFANMIILILLLVVGVFAISYFGGKLVIR